ncbi:NAD(P)/FAD-dependent oxidoreductase [Undibacterium sp. RTI2.1]|uniref:NAD(P)/FAD-dependent oxidoreductase n=1 Tax=unclassified Undibacterium TaxID=2630295 RepID=UPI002AB3F858|nr:MULTISPECIES: NAD(P)/FAD-dependent oxidoreductase [unclassified Undibacterium]MDY7539208.1 NAD(P)/FAD-dependent oxidoreductase [Undibacterium sp. 5I1]MEB0031059.1 NAD(P)/FAD-dependent oxidoreductase [Undibacterium sp. RTI2.1]MEB0116254.1 NAD(P)/FAD-dependent oxidoreductase [Undibacterium sp. RTI2.2]MEB0231121.1 NAD(P)/FAD-dependent oxidoreductase [Undibacterium sp. 10I3]MEB0256994.1 NAD(P)/FAD-dependent oxidoreductase [Undibacterium sp. 5I1]
MSTIQVKSNTENQAKNQAAGLHKITIVGGGAGGLELAVRLGKKLGRKKKAIITLIDASRTHLWKPLLHQVAAGTLDSHADEREYFALARSNHFEFRLGRMDGLSREKKEIYLSATCDEDGSELLPRQAIAYDSLVIALGSQTNDFGTPGARENSIMLDSLPAAERFHQKLVNCCLRAQTQAQQSGEGRFTVTIIGGGATGVELAAELHMTTKILSSYGLVNFHPEKDLKIVIVDAAPRLLQMLPERLSDAVARELRSIAVEVHTNERVVEVTKEGVSMSSGKFIPSGIVVWAAGIKAPEFLKDLDGLETNRINQLVVHRTLQTTRDTSIFALGDCCACPQGEGLPTVPPRAQSAHQQASLLADSLSRMLQGKSLKEFTYKDYGSLVSLGNYTTVGSLMGALANGSVFIEGTLAKWMYWSLHKNHQVAVNGLFHTWLSTWAETIDRVRNPRIKLH